MTSDDLSTTQAEKLKQQAGFCLRFLNNLCKRMDRVRFEPTDELYRAAQTARNALQDLHVAAHYATCEHGVGRLAKVKADELNP